VKDRLRRCAWGAGEGLMRYHDEDWGVPTTDDRRHFEFLVLESAQAGLSWETIWRKREGYRRAFAAFDPSAVARFDERKVPELLADPGIVRNRQKIVAAIANARAFLRVQQEFGSFDAYLRRFAPKRSRAPRRMSDLPAKTAESEALSRDLVRRGFSLVGPVVMYAHMQAVGLVNDHVVGCFRRAEIERLRSIAAG
jgi:DNA-3-methyladenine glycosylase I